MGQLIDIRERLGRGAKRPAQGNGGAIFRVRLCGPDLRWIGLIGGILAGAFAREGFFAAFDGPEYSLGGPPMLCLRAGRQMITETGPARNPGLVVAGTEAFPALLQGCDEAAVLLAPEADPEEVRRLVFPGRKVPLSMADAEPLGTAVACAGGAARLLGAIGWSELALALNQELTLNSRAAEEHYLQLALEAYDQLAPWAGVVPEIPEETSP